MGVDMLSISATQAWRDAFPGAAVGLLELSGVDNTPGSSSLDLQKREAEERLHRRFQGFTRPDFLALPVISAYDRYYNRFDKTYHVLLQVESIVLKGKNLPAVSLLVDANFTAEVETQVLTAGHDVSRLQGQISIDVSAEGDHMTLMSGVSRPIRPGDMIMRDGLGVCCSIIYGQDNRSPISPKTSQALYVAYAPAGVPPDLVETQLGRIEGNIRLFAGSAVLVRRGLLFADSGWRPF
jgi:DNA/RNA-binding domain of Phe-tRNA-synthetase-like protein